jgi:hypothetical protein
MKSIWSLLCAPGLALSAFRSPPGFSWPIKSRSSQANNVAARGRNPRERWAKNVSARGAGTVRPFQSQKTRLGCNPWAAGAKPAPLPTATHF